MFPPRFAKPFDIREYRPFNLASDFPAVAPDQACPERFQELKKHQKTVWGGRLSDVKPGHCRSNYLVRSSIPGIPALTGDFDSRLINAAAHDPYAGCNPWAVAALPYPMPKSPGLASCDCCAVAQQSIRSILERGTADNAFCHRHKMLKSGNAHSSSTNSSKLQQARWAAAKTVRTPL